MTSVKKYDPTYNVVLRAYKPADATKVAKVTVKRSFAEWFDTEGTFVKKPFEKWLGENAANVEKQLAEGKRKKEK